MNITSMLIFSLSLFFMPNYFYHGNEMELPNVIDYYQNNPQSASTLTIVSFVLVVVCLILLIFSQRNKNHLLKKTQEDAIAYQKELQRRVERDWLTDIYNEETFCKKTEVLVKSNPDITYALIRFDIAHFKMLSEVFGVMDANKLLVSIANGMKREVTGKGTYGRINSDHFVLCVPYDKLDVDYLVDYVTTRLNNQGYSLELTPHFGICIINDVNEPIRIVSDKAYTALKKTKAGMNIKYTFYDESLNNKMKEEQQILGEFSDALNDGQFQIYLQPIYSFSENKIVCAEALVRWIHPSKGIIAPMTFIPLLEQNGLINKLDYYVWEQVAKFISLRQKADLPLIPVSVNVSRISFYKRNIYEDFTQLVNTYGIAPQSIKIEITESVYAQNPSVLYQTTMKLQQAGFHVYMDDFGSGYSSLNILKEVPVDTLKLDMKFLEDFERNTKTGSIVTSVVRMARWLNVNVIAEGVETLQQADYLKSIGCDQMQGYLYAKPMPITDFTSFLLENKSISFVANNFEDVDNNVGDILGGSVISTKLFNSVACGIGVYEYVNGDVELIRANQTYYLLLKYNSLSVGNDANCISKKIYNDDRPLFLQVVNQVVNSRTQKEILIRRYRNDGVLCHYDCLVSNLTNGDRPLVLVSFTDVSDSIIKEQKVREQNLALKRQYDYIQSILNILPCGIMEYSVLSNENRLIYYNDAVWRIFGYNSRAEFNKDIYENGNLNNIYPDDLSTVREKIKSVLTSGKMETFEHRVVKFDGTVSYVSVSLEKIIGIDGKELIHSVFTDISEQKKFAQFTQSQNSLVTNTKVVDHNSGSYRLIAEAMDITVLEWDFISNKFTSSQTFVKYEASMYAPFDLVKGLFISNTIFIDDTEIFAKNFSQIYSGKTVEMMVRMKMRNGTNRWSRMTFLTIYDSKDHTKKSGVICTISDCEEQYKMQTKLQNTSVMLDAIVSNIPSGAALFELNTVDKTLLPKFFNEQACKLIGVSLLDIQNKINNNERLERVHGLSDKFNAMLKNMVPNDVKEEVVDYRRVDGTIVYLRIRVSVMSQKGNFLSCFMTIVDVTDLVNEQRNEKWKAEKYKILSEMTNAVIFDYDVSKDVLSYTINTDKGQNVEIRENFLKNEHFYKYASKSEIKPLLDAFVDACNNVRRNECEFMFDFFSGKRWYKASYVSITDENGTIYRIVGKLEDIQKEKQAESDKREKEKSLQKKAEIDSVTGIHNRATIEEKINNEIIFDSQNDISSTLVELDVDDFKDINDTYGHLIGDKFLRLVADAIISNIGENDLCGRFGGDEFVFYVKRKLDKDRFNVFFEKVVGKIKESASKIGVLDATVSMGVTEIEKQDTFTTAYKKSDESLYKAKESGKDCYQIYSK